MTKIPNVGSRIIFSEKEFKVAELIDYFPEEIQKFTEVEMAGETDAKILLAHLVNENPTLAGELRETWQKADREERKAIAPTIVSKFPDEVKPIQARLKAAAPKHLKELLARVIVRFEDDELCQKCFASELEYVEAQDVWTLPGVLHYPAVDEMISHDSEEGLVIDSIERHKETALALRYGESGSCRIVKFRSIPDEDGRQKDVSCLVEDLVWLEEDTAWYLPGRLLSKADRAEWQQATGSRFPPHPAKHVEARRLLRLSRGGSLN